MVLERWDPFREIRRMERRMDHAWRRLGVGEVIQSWAVPLDVVEDGDSVTVRATLPGVKPDDIDITIEEGLLTIKANSDDEREERNEKYLVKERRTGRFHRTLRLPDTLDVDKAETGYDNGVLTLTFPKLEASKPKKLELKVAK